MPCLSIITLILIDFETSYTLCIFYFIIDLRISKIKFTRKIMKCLKIFIKYFKAILVESIKKLLDWDF